MKQKQTPKDRVYRLKRKATPRSFILPTKNSRRFPLLYFDEEKNVSRALRYASNQKSPFEDEQDENPIVEPVIFEDGMLRVPKSNPVLQQFLYYHPKRDIDFEEVDVERDAEKELEAITTEADALIEAKSLTVEQMETMARALFGYDPSRVSTKELKRDIMVFARNNPSDFMNAVSDPELRLVSDVHGFFDKGLLSFRRDRKEVWFNTSGNKKKMLSIPYGEEPYEFVSNYLKTDDGIEALKTLEAYSEEL